ncbi:General L-amino acid-binding periplasmic protein AapJ [uncultured Gammaproteobacteria bacterium]
MNHASIAVAAGALAVALTTTSAQAGPTFDAVKAKGFIQCGVNTALAGFSAPDSAGRWTGLDVDVCRAMAAAVFGDANKVKFVPLSAQQRFPALQSGEVDVLSRNTTWTLTRDTANGFNFGPPVFYDGQGFMVPKKLGVKSARDLEGATICVQTGTTTELNLADYFRSNSMSFQPVVIEALAEVSAVFFAGRCDVFTSDTSQMASVRAANAPKPDDYVILPELISKEPLTPAVRHGDDQWFDILKWTVFATLEAEERGITSKTVDQFLTSKDPGVQRLLGTSPGMGAALGLSEKWAYEIIKQVGNYGEIFDRNVGTDSPLRLSRGLNAQWTKGGIMYAPPIR